MIILYKYNMMRNALMVFSLGLITPVCQIFTSNEYVRKKMIKYKFDKEISLMKLRPDHIYIKNPVFDNDIHECIRSKSGGVKIIWAPPGAGKTTSIRQVLKSEIINKNLSGAIIMNAPRMMPDEPDIWFRSELELYNITTLKQNESLSSLISNEIQPYAIVIDQCDNFRFDEKMKVFIKSLAEDSHLTKKYIVFIICTDASKAKTMKEWNGGIKIKLLSDNENTYKWNNDMIKEWITHFLHCNQNSKLKDYIEEFEKIAIVAGTPDFLITNTIFDEHKNISETIESWRNNSLYIKSIWKTGKGLLYFKQK